MLPNNDDLWWPLRDEKPLPLRWTSLSRVFKPQQAVLSNDKARMDANTCQQPRSGQHIFTAFSCSPCSLHDAGTLCATQPAQHLRSTASLPNLPLVKDYCNNAHLTPGFPIL